MYTLKR